jgi:hypothetical protein
MQTFAAPVSSRKEKFPHSPSSQPRAQRWLSGRHDGPSHAVPPRPTPEVSQLRASVAAVTPAPEAAAPLALAEIPDAQAKAEGPATETVPTTAIEQAKVAKRKVAQHHQRRFAGAFAQFGGWGWFGFGGYRRF